MTDKKYTPEPWFVGEHNVGDEKYLIIHGNHNKDLPICTINKSAYLSTEDRFNASRIALCVNSLSGLTPKEIKSLPKQIYKYNLAVEERDELIEALSLAIGTLQSYQNRLPDKNEFDHRTSDRLKETLYRVQGITHESTT